MSGSMGWGRVLLWLFGTAVVLFLLLPVAAIVPLSFSSGSFLQYPLPGLSLRWYADFLASDFWLPALRNSLLIGTAAAALATVLGVPAALALWNARGAWARAAMALFQAPLVVPTMVVGVALLLFLGPLGLTGTFAGMVAAHAALGAPFVVTTVLASLGRFDPAQLRAAASCGAGPWLAFRRVLLPQIAPGVAAGGVFAFATSLDEVTVALLIAGPGQRTLPRQMFAGLNDQVSLTITAAATVMVLLAAGLLAAVAWLRRRGAA